MTKVLLLIALFPANVYAQVPTGGMSLIGFQVLLYIWPLILPLFFLRAAKSKLKSYGGLLIAVYGVIGILSIPGTFISRYFISTNGGGEAAYYMAYAGIQLIAFIASIIFVLRFRPGILVAVHDEGS